jgi:hypothetical protein
MDRATVSIANAHDGVALTAIEAERLALLLISHARDMTYDERQCAAQVVAILQGKRRDGSELEAGE